MKFHLSAFFVVIFLLSSCSKKQEAQEEIYSSSYKVISVTNGGTIKGTVKTDPAQKYIASIETQKDQDVCGTSHANTSIQNENETIPKSIIYLEIKNSWKYVAKT